MRSWVNCCRSRDLSFYFMNFRVAKFEKMAWSCFEEASVMNDPLWMSRCGAAKTLAEKL